MIEEGENRRMIGQNEGETKKENGEDMCKLGCRNSKEEEKMRKRTKEGIRGDSHSVLTENRSRRGLLIKRYWILVTLHSICWQLGSCAAA